MSSVLRIALASPLLEQAEKARRRNREKMGNNLRIRREEKGKRRR
jgi:hypothetical protein